MNPSLTKKQLKQQFKKRIYTYILRLVKFLSKLPKDPVIREIISQVMRSGTSIGANFFESISASSKKDYINFFTYCLKSANETKFWLALLIDSGLVPQNLIAEGKWLLQESKELANIFAKSIITMKGMK